MKDPFNTAATQSNETFSSLFETMDQGVVYQDEAGVIIRANPAAERILGLSRDQMLGRSSLDPRWKCIREDGSDIPGGEHPSMIALRTGRPVVKSVMGVYLPDLDELRWILVSSVPDLFRDGAPRQTITTFTDITDLKNAEERLHQTEKRFRNLFDTMHEGFAFHEVICNDAGEVTDYRYLDINPAFEQLTGLKRDTTIGRTVREVLPDIEEEWIHCFGKVALTGIPDERESYVRELDRYYRARAYSPERGTFAVVFEETTARRQAEETLKASERRFSQLISNSFDTIVILDADGIQRYVSASAERVHGYAPAELVDIPVIERMIHPDDQERVQVAFRQIIETGAGGAQYRHRCKTGGWVHLEARGTNQLENPDIRGVVVNVRDITEHREQERALRESRDLFALFMKYSPIYTFIKEIDANRSRVLEVSDNYIDMVGIPAAELRGRTMEEIFPADFARKITEDDLAVISRGNVLTLEESLNGLDYITIKFPILREGQSSLLAGFTIDITARKRVEEALREKEQYLQTIFDASPECIKLLARDGSLLVMNRAGLEMIEADSLDQVKGQRVSSLVVDRDRPAFEALTERVFNGETCVLEFEAVGLHGRPIWLETHAVPFRNAATQITALLGLTRDVTERKQSESERISMERQLLHAQKLESLGVLAGGIAHDFNNILMAIIGNADLALMRISTESPAVENLHKIEKAAARAADLARQMLAYSGKGKFVVEQIDLNKLLEEMLHMLEVSISKKAVLRINPYHPLPTVEADATQMRQIVMNLVINASEAMGEDSGIIAVTTGVMDCDRNYLSDVWLDENLTEGLYVYLEITDTGCGMDKETLAKLFDPFFTTKFTGRGLGMAAVLGIVRGHKGAIKVYSEPNRGTTFKIMLPASDKPAKQFNGRAGNNGWRGSGTVLLVDDEETVRGVGTEMLKELGFEVITATDGRDALDKYRKYPDITFVILDLTMPHMDGEQCFRELRQLKPDVKVIMSSGFSEQEVTQKFAGKGLAGFIHKPYKLSTLREAAAALVQNK